MSAKQYELDLTLAFWFAVHMEDLPTAQALMQEEFLLKQLVACALINKPDDDEDAFDEDMSENEESEQNWQQESANIAIENSKMRLHASEKLNKQSSGSQYEGGEDERPGGKKTVKDAGPKKSLG